MTDLIEYLAREYPTATAKEIALTLEMPVPVVRSRLDRSLAADAAERARRRGYGMPETDEHFVRLMRRRIAGRLNTHSKERT
jgi:hypothetical protein